MLLQIVRLCYNGKTFRNLLAGDTSPALSLKTGPFACHPALLKREAEQSRKVFLAALPASTTVADKQ